jgi:hypothetical protein
MGVLNLAGSSGIYKTSTANSPRSRPLLKQLRVGGGKIGAHSVTPLILLRRGCGSHPVQRLLLERAGPFKASSP